jgi:hypothetical protein
MKFEVKREEKKKIINSRQCLEHVLPYWVEGAEIFQMLSKQRGGCPLVSALHVPIIFFKIIFNIYKLL